MDGKQGLEGVAARSFSHITIGQDDVDEVIQAGIVDELPSVEQPVGSVVEEAISLEPEPVLEPEPEKPASEPAKKPVADQGYHETTLEDLKGESMPFAQKVVLFGALALIVVAVVYWFFIR